MLIIVKITSTKTELRNRLNKVKVKGLELNAVRF